MFSFRHGGVGASVGVRPLASVASLPSAVADFVKGAVEECKPSNVHVVTGTPEETANILSGLENEGMVKRLPKYQNWYERFQEALSAPPPPPSAFLPNPRFARSWLARTDPKDVARVESKTVIVTQRQRDTVPVPAAGVKSQLGSWMSESDWQRARRERFPGCMAGVACSCAERTWRRE